jgi:hypothetical protein
MPNPSASDILAVIKSDLYQYCRELAVNIDTKTGLAAKYFVVPPVSFDPNQDIVDSGKRRAFLTIDPMTGQSPFDEFFQKLIPVLEAMDSSDINSIRKGNETPNAQAFRDCVELLNEAKFYNVNGKPINFWSGPEAQKMANTVSTSLSDSNVPAISILSKLGGLLKANRRDLSDKMFNAGSAEFTGQATGDVIVYSSAANANETLPLLNVGNFHWNVELPILQMLMHEGIVKKIEFTHYLHRKEVTFEDFTWLRGMDLSDKDASLFLSFSKNDPGIPYVDSKPIAHNSSYVDAGSLAADTSYVDSRFPTVDVPYVDPSFLPADTSYVDSPFTSVDVSYVDSSFLPVDTSFVESKSVSVDSSYVGSTSPAFDLNRNNNLPTSTEEKGVWLKPVDFTHLRLTLRRLSLPGTEAEKIENRNKWINEAQERPSIEVSKLQMYFDRWKERTFNKPASGKQGFFGKTADTPIKDSQDKPDVTPKT